MNTTRTNASHASVGTLAVPLADALANEDVMFVASDKQRAEPVAAALRSAAPEAIVIHCPSSDAIPGDSAPATPANVGRRFAALRRLRQATENADRSRIALVTTAEAAACAFPPPAAFDAAPPALTVGDPLDFDTLSLTLEEIGYFAADRVDEPGEMAVRGQVVDLFPADASHPARIEVNNGEIIAIRVYDPTTQLGTEELRTIEIGRASEPSVEADWVTLFEHLPDAAMAIDPDASRRRDRFVALARDAAGRSRSIPVADEARWNEALAGRRPIEAPAGQKVPRFVESKAPLRPFAKAARDVLGNGGKVLVLGAARDLRFSTGGLRRRQL